VCGYVDYSKIVPVVPKMFENIVLMEMHTKMCLVPLQGHTWGVQYAFSDCMAAG
jgi:hypothetical protein